MKSAISVLAWKSQIQMSDLSRPRRLATFFLLAATAALAVSIGDTRVAPALIRER